MKIAIIGWGSLIWNPDGLPHDGLWREGGPRLPIEFSRISPDGRLTLIIDHVNGAEVVTRYSLSTRQDVQQAVQDLATREVCTPAEIGYLDQRAPGDSLAHHPDQPDVLETIRNWCREHDLDAALWTALPSTFEARQGQPFSVDDALDYVRSLTGETRRRALEYLRNAPPQVDTPLRRAFHEDPISN